jgi:hypothetical protein
MKLIQKSSMLIFLTMKLTADCLPESNLLIIGEGTWGKKVLSVLSGGHHDADLISAREFLTNRNEAANFEPENIYWICTRPDLQIKILEKLIHLGAQKVILEKPFFTSHEEFNSLEGMIKGVSATKIFVSEPWRHSSLWEGAKTVIFDLMNEADSIQIRIDRSSSELRDFIDPVQDWLPHDFSLIFDLALELGESETQIVRSPVTKDNLMQGSVSIGRNIQIDFSIGFSSRGRTAQWVIGNGDQTFMVDFTALKIQSFENPESRPVALHTRDNPLINQYEWVSRQSYDPDLLDKLRLQKTVLIPK